MDDYVSKPVKPGDLGAVLERWVLAADPDMVRKEAPIDRDVLARLRGLQDEDEADIVADLAGMFLEDARSGLQTVEEALHKGDAPTIETVAHKLKGGSGNLGAGDWWASSHGWKTWAHPAISQRASSCSNDFGRSWGWWILRSRPRSKGTEIRISGEVVPARQSSDRFVPTPEYDIALGNLADHGEGYFDFTCQRVEDGLGDRDQELVIFASCGGKNLGVAHEGFCQRPGVLVDG